MVKNVIIILLSLLLLFVSGKKLISWAKKWAKNNIPNHYRRLKRIVKGDCNVRDDGKDNSINPYPIFPILSKEQEERLTKAIRLTFTGDLILLQDMVENGYDSTTGHYSFDSMFRYVKSYYDEADCNIGVFEGPSAGPEEGYTTSCFDDGIPLYLNFPKEYAEAIKRAGFDLVTLANNHLLDKEVSGVYRTLDELDNIGLDHVGAYRNEEEKSSVKIVEVKGKKIAVLAYTFGSNYYDTDFFFKAENQHLTNIIVSPQSPYIKQTLDAINRDFERA